MGYKKVLMRSTAASPDHVLHAGETYILPDSLADQLLNGKMVHGQTTDGKPIHGGPCATLVKGPSKAVRPGKPDPEEQKVMHEEGYDGDDAEEDDEE